MFDFYKEYTLENQNVRLSPMLSSDYENLLHFSVQEPEIWTYSLVQADSPEKLKTYIEKAIKDRNNQNSYPFVVFDKRQNKYAGSTRFYDMQLDNAALQLGYTWYGKDFQGTGLNKNCKFLMLEFAFEFLQMERVEFRADVHNQRSINAMKSIGCTQEGIIRSHALKANGQRRDSVLLSILKSEWQERVKEKLQAAIQ